LRQSISGDGTFSEEEHTDRILDVIEHARLNYAQTREKRTEDAMLETI
jgi:hypothetical protein